MIDIKAITPKILKVFYSKLCDVFAKKDHTHTIDSELSETSTNPVENKVVTEAINDSNKRISNNGYGEVAGGKNLINLDNILKGHLITFDTGTVVQNSSYFLTDYIKIEGGKNYTKSGFGQNLGSENWFFDKNKNKIQNFGNDHFTTPSNAEYVRLSGFAGNESTCQLELGLETTSYEPYFPSNKALDDIKADKKETTVNLLNPSLENTAQDGITYTNNNDGSLTFTGTSTAKTYFAFDINKYLSKGKYNLVGEKKDGTNFYITKENDFDYVLYSGVIEVKDSTYYRAVLKIYEGITLDNFVLHPMLTTNLNATIDDFVPYTGVTGRLNSDVSEIIRNIPTSVPANGGNADTANKLNVSLTLAGGDDNNTTGYKLISKIDVPGPWTNKRGLFLIQSRHSGNGILAISIVCDADTVSQNNTCVQINYFGNSNAIYKDSYLAYVSNDGSTVYIFEKYLDYSILNIITVISQFDIGDFGWELDIDNTKYGVLKAYTQINEGESVDWNDISNKPTIPSIANNLTTTSSGYVLDARQGKALNDKINSIQLDLAVFKSDKSTIYITTDINMIPSRGHLTFKDNIDIYCYGGMFNCNGRFMFKNFYSGGTKDGDGNIVIKLIDVNTNSENSNINVSYSNNRIELKVNANCQWIIRYTPSITSISES